MSSGVSLYYPYIHILNEGWLKRSLLYWDQVRRIVPDGVRPDDYGDCYRAKRKSYLLQLRRRPIYQKQHRDSELRFRLWWRK